MSRARRLNIGQNRPNALSASRHAFGWNQDGWRNGRRRSRRRCARSPPSRPAWRHSPQRSATDFPNRSRRRSKRCRTISGRVIVTGVGKSGHIGSKIAATLASTGTPAFFVHPSEANHGDLGMIARDDAIIAMSWSGESLELKGIVAYARRFAIPLIAITARRTSALAREANVVLCLPRAPEACPHGLAPTTSTLLQLAIGDALAVALLEARGFTPDHFRDLHPGGQLGANLTQVREIMHRGDELPVGALGHARCPRRSAMLVEEALRLRLRRRRRRAAGRHRHRRRPRPQPAAQSGRRRAVDDIMTRAAEDGEPGDAGGRGARPPQRAQHQRADRGRRGPAGRRRPFPRPAADRRQPESRREAELSRLRVGLRSPMLSETQTASTTSSRSMPRCLHAHLRARGQVGAGHPPQRVADADAAAAVLDRLGQRRQSGRPSARRAG